MSDKSSASFMRSLCLGEIEEALILPFPRIDDTEAETLRGVVDSVNDLLKGRDDDFRQWDEDAKLPDDFLTELKQFGLFSLVIPEEHGGLGFKAAAYSRALQALSHFDASVAITVGAHSSIGMRGLLLFGNEEQRARYYPKLATGEMVAGFCLTEPGAGSDAAALKTTAEEHDDHWLLSGQKIWVTNGGYADFFTVFAKTGQEGERGKLSAFIVTRDMEGVSVGPHEDKMGIRASATNTLYLEDVKVPKENLLGERGKGFKVAMQILNSGRTGLGGGCVGGMKKLISLATVQAKEREQFGRPISEFGLIQQKVGHMVVECYAAESVVSMVAGLMDRGYEDYSVEAAISKVFATECLYRTADEALQLAGGSGFMREYPYERVLRDCRIFRIFEGTNDILRLFVALNAMQEAGERLKAVSQSLSNVLADPIKGFGVLTNYARRRARLADPRKGKMASFTQLHESLADEASIFEDAARKLAVTVDRLLRKHGKKIIDRQFATRRLADIMIDLYVLASVLSRVDSAIREKGEEACQPELQIAKVFAGQARGRVARNFRKIDSNDDELIKALAAHAFEQERFSWDTI